MHQGLYSSSIQYASLFHPICKLIYILALYTPLTDRRRLIVQLDYKFSTIRYSDRSEILYTNFQTLADRILFQGYVRYPHLWPHTDLFMWMECLHNYHRRSCSVGMISF
uniref:Uncharacterized protein n=1 Tax=Glossina brevipalpis TaxID=37001 RepID=A0A1A9WM23_9MUSC